jgi:hypothetical protein
MPIGMQRQTWIAASAAMTREWELSFLNVDAR